MKYITQYNPSLPMKQDRTREYMKKNNTKNWLSWSIRNDHRLVLRTAAAYADSKNTDKYNSLTGLNTVIYGKK